MKHQDKRKAKGNVCTELTEGMTALADSRAGKRTLLTHAVEFKPAREQGRAIPNAQATLLINLVKLFPDMVERLAAV